MTVIAYDGKSLAADRRHSTSGDVLLDPAEKLRVSEHGAVAASGNTKSQSADLALLEEVAAGRTDGLKYDASALVLLADGRAFKVQDSNAFPIHKPQAIGSGYEVAMGAMATGVDAKTAVEIACRLVLTCGDGVDVYTPGEDR